MSILSSVLNFFLIGKTFKSNVCGHSSKKTTFTQSGGRISLTRTYVTGNGIPDYCPQCIADMTAICPKCGDMIRIGDRVVLYHFNERIKGASTTMRNGIVCMVGCAHCASEMALTEFKGYWMPPGKVIAANTVASAHVFSQEHAVVYTPAPRRTPPPVVLTMDET